MDAGIVATVINVRTNNYDSRPERKFILTFEDGGGSAVTVYLSADGFNGLTNELIDFDPRTSE